MDSLTQFALGAAIGEAVLGRRIAAKAMLYGGAIATLPDLDVFIPMGSPVADFVYHRSWTHSLIVLAVAAPIVAWVIHRLRGDPPEWYRTWLLLAALALLTHPLLDAFTVYGTQLLWPLTNYPFGVGSMFIIDPAYTLTLICGLIAARYYGIFEDTRRRAIAGALVLSTMYLAWSVAAQTIAAQAAEAKLPEGFADGERITIAAPFNTLLWRTIAVSDDGSRYAVGYNSLIDGQDGPRFTPFDANHALLDGLETYWPVARLKAFTGGIYRVREAVEAAGDAEIKKTESRLVLTDLRMGVEGRYVFSFVVGTRQKEGEVVRSLPTPNARVVPQRDLSGFGRVFARIIDPTIEIVPRSE
ncbi:MAG: metal-dependent hydrolase [Pseudomonadota bacterium]